MRKLINCGVGVVKKYRWVFLIFLVLYVLGLRTIKSPKYSDLLFDLSSDARKHGHLHEAQRYAKRAVFYNPENAEAYNLLGLLSLDLGDAQIALQYFYQAIGQDVFLYESYYEIGNIYKQNGNLSAALRYFKQAKKSSIKRLSPSSEIYFSIADIYEQKNDYEHAFNNYFSSMELDGENKEVFQKCVNLLKKIGDLKEYKKRAAIFEWRNFPVLADRLNRIIEEASKSTSQSLTNNQP